LSTQYRDYRRRDARRCGSAVLARIDRGKVLVPSDADWLAAGELAGRTARAVGGGKIATAFDRVELISDALTAILAARSGLTVVTDLPTAKWFRRIEYASVGVLEVAMAYDLARIARLSCGRAKKDSYADEGR
jgi:hypothetical protein